MKKLVILDELDWGQIIDGLICRAELYEETVCYYESSIVEREIAEVRDADEARLMAGTYRRIVSAIEKSLAERGIA